MSERRTNLKLTNSRPRGEDILSEKEREKERQKKTFRDEKHQRHFRRRIERESVGMSSRLWASLKARSSQRNHGGDGPRPVLQPSRDQVCQWRRCVCGVCFCVASSRSFYSRFISKRIGEFRNFEPINRSENRVFLRLSFFLSRTKGKKSENLLRVRLVGANPWSKLIRTNA